jgi:hypothetical protein
MTLNMKWHPVIDTVVLSPLSSHLNASGCYDFWVEVEAHWHLKRIIAKLERKLVKGISGSDGHLLLAKIA